MYETIASHATQATVRGCWRQWRALMGDGLGAGEQPARAIIDPEALVVASLAVRHEERRFRDLLLWWAHKGAHLLSVQRLRTVASAFPESALDGGVGWFAKLALDAGDGRWKRLSSENALQEPARSGKGPKELHLLEPSTLMLRMRAGFGVGAKADLITFLIGASSTLRTKEIWTTAGVVSEAIGYSRASVSRAAKDMSLARFIETSADRPPMYSLEVEHWARVLQLRDPYGQHSGPSEESGAPFDIPPWRFWAQFYGFLLASVGWAREAMESPVARVVDASRARDITARHGRYLAWTGVDLPDERILAGERYLAPFREVVEQVARRVEPDL